MLSFRILTSGHRDERQQVITETWLKQSDGSLYDHIFATDSVNKIGNQISFTPDNTYASNEEKFILMHNLTRQATNGGWYMFCDDDTVPNVKQIISELPSLSTGVVHGWFSKGSYRKDPSLYYCSGGAGYLINSSLIAGNPAIKDRRFGWADVNFGLWMRENKIRHRCDSRFFHNHPSHKELDIDNDQDWPEIKKHNSFHYVKKPSEVVKLHAIFSL